MNLSCPSACPPYFVWRRQAGHPLLQGEDLFYFFLSPCGRGIKGEGE